MHKALAMVAYVYQVAVFSISFYDVFKILYFHIDFLSYDWLQNVLVIYWAKKALLVASIRKLDIYYPIYRHLSFFKIKVKHVP